MCLASAKCMINAEVFLVPTLKPLLLTATLTLQKNQRDKKRTIQTKDGEQGAGTTQVDVVQKLKESQRIR